MSAKQKAALFKFLEFHGHSQQKDRDSFHDALMQLYASHGIKGTLIVLSAAVESVAEMYHKEET